MESFLKVFKKNSEVKNLIIGVLLGYAVTFIGFLVYAMILTYTDTSDEKMGLIITLITVLSVLISGFDTAKKSKNKGLLWGILAGLTYSIIMVTVGKFFVENFSFDFQTILLIILSILVGGVGGIFGINLKSK